MQLFFKEEINVYYKMFARESQKSKTGMAILDDFVRKIHDDAMKANDIHEIQRLIRILSVFGEILQTFNANIESLISSVDEHVFNEVMANSSNAQCLRVKDWLTDLSSYQIDDKFNGIVSYILDSESKLCYVKDLTKHESIDFQNCLHSAFEGIPEYGNVFALEINQKFLRAIRIDSHSTNMSIRVRLIDVGETISVSPNAYKYHLTDDVKCLPPMAILCRVEKINGKVVNSLESLYKKVLVVKIKDICVNMLVINLSAENESVIESMCTVSENQQKEIQYSPSPIIPRSAAATPNPFFNVSLEQDNHCKPTPVIKDNQITNGHKQICNEIQDIYKNNDQNNGFNDSPKKKESSSVAQPIGQTRPMPPVPPRQRPKALAPIRIPIDIVKRSREKPCEPAMNNVESNNAKNMANGNEAKPMNLIGSPEKDVVKLNGAHPKVPQTQKENEVFHTQPVREDLFTPAIGEEKVITPIHIVTAEQIYVQYNDWYNRFEDFQFNALQKVQLQQLSYIPKINDEVLARYSGDGMIYRARVEMIEQQIVTVFYVDYGNTENVDFDSLFEWDAICDKLPFQAVRCLVDNIRYLSAASTPSIFKFMQLNYLNKTCKALILDSSEGGLVIKLTNAYGRDIVEEINANLFPECIV